MLSRISAIVCAAWVASASQPVEPIQDASPRLWTVTLSADVDGSGIFHFTSDGLIYKHKHWGRPSKVLFNGQPWGDLARTPDSWSARVGQVDLSQAWVVRREGRDTVAFEKSANGFSVYMNDSPNGADAYSITVAIPLVEQSL